MTTYVPTEINDLSNRLLRDLSDKKYKSLVILYADGSCKGNPGLGGWAYCIVDGKGETTGWKAEGHTTNNKMELLAVINGLLAIKQPSNVLVRSDSNYVVQAINQKWIKDWERKEWHRKGKLIPNYDLWQRLLHAMECHLSVAFEWTDETDPHLKAVDELAKGAT